MRSPGKEGSPAVGSPVLALRWVAVVHGCSEVAEEDDHPCWEVCRRKRLRTQGAVGSPSGVRNRDVLDAGSKGHSVPGEEAVCASD
jgi:hypothetical protein